MPETHIHVTHVEPYLETQGWFIEQFTKDPQYDYTQEPYCIGLFTDAYTPAYTDTLYDIPCHAVGTMHMLNVQREGDELRVEDITISLLDDHVWAGLIIWIPRPHPVLILSSTQGFPCRTPLRLSFDCARLADQIQHAAYDAQCVRGLLQAGRLHG